MDSEIVIFQIIVLIFSVIIHEVSHGAMANHLGDPTAKRMGRLSLNPMKHLDPLGSFVVPFFLIITHAPFVFGWAKPVPFNPYNLRDQKYGQAKVAMAGPMANLLLAFGAGVVLRFLPLGLPQTMMLGKLLSIVVLINILLAIFNLIPIPPLDGSKILFTFLPARMWKLQRNLEQYGFVILLAFIMLFSNRLWPIILFIYKMIVGHFNFLI